MWGDYSSENAVENWQHVSQDLDKTTRILDRETVIFKMLLTLLRRSERGS